jgi:hypothetical protein
MLSAGDSTGAGADFVGAVAFAGAVAFEAAALEAAALDEGATALWRWRDAWSPEDVAMQGTSAREHTRTLAWPNLARCLGG